MTVKAIDCAGKEHVMFEEIDSFKVSYDDHEVLHVKMKDNKFEIWSENGPFEDNVIGSVDKYVVEKDEDKKIYITQASTDVYEFMEV